MTQPDATQLHQFLVDHFSLDELKTLCFNLGVEYDDLSGDGRAGKARELVKAMQRRGRTDHLVAHLSIAHPDIYRQQFHEAPAIPVASARLRRNRRQVFISHAHQDAAFAQRLAADLRARGFPVWIAPDDIRIGEDWPDAIDRGLDESGVIVVALTPHALASYWVRKEASTARLLAGRNLVRFVLLDVAECEAPSSWYTYQNVSFRHNYERGLSELLRYLNGEHAAPAVTPAPPLPRAPALPDRRIHEKTGIELIRIPAGPFLYGEGKERMELPEFWLGRYPVTNAQYKRFLDATPGRAVPYSEVESTKPYSWDRTIRSYPADKADHPVVLVNWHDVQAFCAWAGLALPTEEQWEKAARGTDGRSWPWGDEWLEGRCNTMEAGIRSMTAVGRYSPQGDSPYGCADMAGNVWDWTTSWFDELRSRRVLRGGSWNGDQRFARTSMRYYNTPDSAIVINGFRVVAPVVSGF